MRLPTLRTTKKLVHRHLRFVGPGLVSAVAYIDPGNWATDLEAGAKYGYKLLFVVLLAGLAAVVLQTLSVRLGATTAQSLPHQTRRLFIRLETKYPKYRVPLHCGLWTLYVLAEVAIIATDLAELLGSAIALNLLFPRLPLWAGVLITAVDVLIVLAFFSSTKGRQGMLFFEILIVSLVLAVFVSFMVLLDLVKPDWGDVFFGFVPSKTLVDPGALYIGVGIIGATVMPHALFLGSSLAGVDRLNMQPLAPEPKTSFRHNMKKMKVSHKFPSLFRRRGPSLENQDEAGYELDQMDRPDSTRSRPLTTQDLTRPNDPDERFDNGNVENERDMYKEMILIESGDSRRTAETAYEEAVKLYNAEMKSFDRIKWVDIHLKHATVDTIFSLLGFAVTINSSILILAGATFFYNPNATGEPDIPGAFELMKTFIGNGAAIVFAIALLCAGQSASITATLAGQVVSEGFINWRTNPTVRRLVTRLISSIPAATVAAAVGQSGLNTMLVASQVLLSIILPTVIFPLVLLCSKDDVMSVEGPDLPSTGSQTTAPPASETEQAQHHPTFHAQHVPQIEAVSSEEGRIEGAGQCPSRRVKSYKSPLWVTILGYVLFSVVVVANVYVIVQLILGNA